MHKSYLKVGLLCAALLPLSACIDNDIEITDVDTTTQIKVDNLTLPVNLDVVKLNDIFDIDNSGRITTVNIDGKEFWAVTEHGEINSDNIDIPKFEASAPTINPSQAKFFLVNLPSAGKTRAEAAVIESDYTFREFDKQYINFSTSVDEAIVGLDEIFMSEMNFAIDFTATGVPSNLDLEFTTLKIYILKGLDLTSLSQAYTYTYDSTSGLLTVSNLKCDASHQAHMAFKATKISNVTDPATGKKSIDINNGNLAFNTEISLEDAQIHTVLHLDPTQTQPTENVLIFNVKTSVGNIKADYISGTVDYTLKGNKLNIDPVDLSDLPNFLDDNRTDLRLANPQIYLNLNNPVAAYNLYYQTGLQFVSLRGNNRTLFPASGQGVTVATRADFAGPYNFVLSPSDQDLNTPDFYKNGLQHIAFTDLGDLLSGQGMPDKIEINLVNPGLPRQKVTHFQLDNSISGIHGYYDFVAPLGLKTGSTIVYSDSKKDWDSEELRKITVTKLVIDADAYSEIPLEAEITAYPLDPQGNKIESFPVRGKLAGTPGKQHITLESSGTFKNLDGVTFEAVVHPSASTPLTPNLTIRLENVKATVSGYYTTDF